MINVDEKSLEDKKIKNIVNQGDKTLVEFEDGEHLELSGVPFEFQTNIHVCSFCGEPGFKDPLFTSGDETCYICKDCTVIAVRTFLEHHIDLELQLPGFGNQIQEMMKNIEQQKK